MQPLYLTVYQGYFSTFKVKLNTKPPIGTQVHINVVSKEPSVLNVLNEELIFTHSDYNEAQEVMVCKLNCLLMF